MPRYEYKVVPAPQKGLKAKGVRSAEARFSNVLETLMNTMGAQGWEYQRAETLPSIERAGLTSTTTEWRNVLVFRRLRETAAEAFSPELLPPPQEPVETEEKAPEPAAATAPNDSVSSPETKPDANPSTASDDADNGVEDASDLSGSASHLEKHAASRNAVKTEG